MVFTEDAFTQAMKDAVVERGKDYRYQKPDGEDFCLYQDPDGNPGCIVGLALHKMGFEYSPDWEKAGPALCLLIGEFGAHEYVAKAAYAAQRIQDAGGTWGEALCLYFASLERTTGRTNYDE